LNPCRHRNSSTPAAGGGESEPATGRLRGQRLPTGCSSLQLPLELTDCIGIILLESAGVHWKEVNGLRDLVGGHAMAGWYLINPKRLLAVLGVVVLAFIIIYPFSPAARQRRDLEAATVCKGWIEDQIGSQPAFKDITMSRGTNGWLRVTGHVVSDSDAPVLIDIITDARARFPDVNCIDLDVKSPGAKHKVLCPRGESPRVLSPSPPFTENSTIDGTP